MPSDDRASGNIVSSAPLIQNAAENNLQWNEAVQYFTSLLKPYISPKEDLAQFLTVWQPIVAQLIYGLSMTPNGQAPGSQPIAASVLLLAPSLIASFGLKMQKELEGKTNPDLATYKAAAIKSLKLLLGEFSVDALAFATLGYGLDQAIPTAYKVLSSDYSAKINPFTPKEQGEKEAQSYSYYIGLAAATAFAANSGYLWLQQWQAKQKIETAQSLENFTADPESSEGIAQTSASSKVVESKNKTSLVMSMAKAMFVGGLVTAVSMGGNTIIQSNVSTLIRSFRPFYFADNDNGYVFSPSTEELANNFNNANSCRESYDKNYPSGHAMQSAAPVLPAVLLCLGIQRYLNDQLNKQKISQGFFWLLTLANLATIGGVLAAAGITAYDRNAANCHSIGAITLAEIESLVITGGALLIVPALVSKTQDAIKAWKESRKSADMSISSNSTVVSSTNHPIHIQKNTAETNDTIIQQY